MQKRILLDQRSDQVRLAVLEDGELCELYIEKPERTSLIGNIYVGRVDNVLQGMQAAFVDIGLEKNGFLSLSDIAIPDAADVGEELLHQKQLKPGNELMVQVLKQPGGDKGVRLTCHITLPGRLLVLLPTLHYIGISKKIEDEEERARLRAIAQQLCPEGMGLIIRTAADGASEHAIAEDIGELTAQWRSIAEPARYVKAPALLRANTDLIERSVRDMLIQDVDELLCDGQELYDRARKIALQISAALADKVRPHRSDTSLFSLFRVESQAEKALDRRVWLKSGGYLIFDYAEALTVIDVNSGKFVGKGSLSETIFKTNCEAAVEIIRQLRLRDIGGIVVIDFIDMDEPAQRDQMLNLLRAELKKDRTKTNLLGFTQLGLVEMTRKKLHESMLGARAVCPVCKGSGRVEHKHKEKP